MLKNISQTDHRPERKDFTRREASASPCNKAHYYQLNYNLRLGLPYYYLPGKLLVNLGTMGGKKDEHITVLPVSEFVRLDRVYFL